MGGQPSGVVDLAARDDESHARHATNRRTRLGQATDRVVRTLSGFPEIMEIHSTNGRWDLIVELSAASLPEFDGVLRRIRLIPGITTSETNLLLNTPRSTRARL